MKISGWTFIETLRGQLAWRSGKLLDSEEDCKTYYENYRETYEPLRREAEVLYVKLSGETEIVDDLFPIFWKAFAGKRKRYKPKAKAKFLSFPQDRQRLIIQNVEDRSKRDKNWLDKNGEYIPMPTTYLNGGGWEDEWEEIKQVKIRDTSNQITSAELDAEYFTQTWRKR